MSDPAESRPAKRVKVEENAVEYTRSDVWYDDGNVVLEAGTMLFRVHKGVLIARSTVLRDMLSDDDASVETDDGYRLVHLSDDPGELKHFLNALYGEASYFKPDVQMEWIALSGFLNLGSKYHVAHLREEALSRLAYDHPTTLQAWKAKRGWRIVRGRTIDVDVINLARQHTLTPRLPFAFYRLAHKSAHEIITPIHCADGAVTVLSHDDQIACLKLKESILRNQAEHQYSWLETEGDKCTDEARCRDARDAVSRKALSKVLNIRPLWGWQYLWKDVGLCKNCRKAAISHYDEYQADFWENLPGFCGLDSWAELNAGGDP